MAHRTGHRQHAVYFDQADPTEHMLGLPKSHPKFGAWIVFTILIGTVLALTVVVIGNFIFR